MQSRSQDVTRYVVVAAYYFAVLFGSRLSYPALSYYGYSQDFQLFRFFISFGVTLLFCKSLRTRGLEVVEIVKWTFLVVAFVPIAVYFANNLGSWGFFCFSIGFSLIFFTMLGSNLSRYVIKTGGFAFGGGQALLYALCISAFLVTIITNGLPAVTALDVSRVYEVRREFSSSPLIEYLRSAALFVAVPLLLGGVSLKRGRSTLLFVIAFCLAMYLSSGAKFVMVALFMGVFFRVAIGFGVSLVALPALLVFVIGAAYFCDILLFDSSPVLSQMIVFRAFIVPAWLSFYWAETFSGVGFLWFSQSLSLFPSPIGDVVAEEFVGDLLFPKEGGSFATVGLIGYSFSNVGWLGLVDAVILGFIFCVAQIVQNSVCNRASWVGIGTAVGVYAMYLTGVNMLSLLASRGFLLLLVFSILFLRK